MHPTTPRVRLSAVAFASLVVLAGCKTVHAEPIVVVTDSIPLRVATYNVNYGLGGDAETLAALLATQADVVLVQEVTPAWVRAFERLKATWPHQAHRPWSDGGGGLSLLSRFPIESEVELDNPHSWFPAQHALVRTSSGTLQLLNLHLRPPFGPGPNIVVQTVTGAFVTDGIRDKELSGFLAELDPRFPAIVAGDFNEADGSAVRRLQELGYDSALARYQEDAVTWRWPVPVIGSWEDAYDHVFVGPGLLAVDAWVMEAGRSDHLPVVAEVVLP